MRPEKPIGNGDIAEFASLLKEEAAFWSATESAEKQISEASTTARELFELRRLDTVSSHRPKARRRLGFVFAAVFGLLLAMTGIGLAADASAPGDPLFGLDQAMERVGIGKGMSAERLAEVAALAEAGEIARGLQHAASALANLPEQARGGSAGEALLAAAHTLSEKGAAPEGVAQLLSHLATSAGEGDGNSVAEFAKQIKDSVDKAKTEKVKENGRPESTPGRPDGLPPKGDKKP